jgi:hypothetical protein
VPLAFSALAAISPTRSEQNVLAPQEEKMNSHADYLDGNAAGGELSRIFSVDVTGAEGKCAHCSTIKRFAEAHVYMDAPGLVARCVICEHVLLRVANVREHTLLDVRGMTYLSFDTSRLSDSGKPADSP